MIEIYNGKKNTNNANANKNGEYKSGTSIIHICIYLDELYRLVHLPRITIIIRNDMRVKHMHCVLQDTIYHLHGHHHIYTDK